jgi:hypothetical protein
MFSPLKYSAVPSVAGEGIIALITLMFAIIRAVAVLGGFDG